MTNDLSNDLSCFENRKDLVLIHLDLSAEAHAHISGCPVNLFSRCFTVTTNKRWKLFSLIFKLFLFLASCLSLTWLEASIFSSPPPFLQWLQLFSISGAAALGTQALATSILDYPNRLLIGLPDPVFSLSDPSYYCWQTGVPKIPLNHVTSLHPNFQWFPGDWHEAHCSRPAFTVLHSRVPTYLSKLTSVYSLSRTSPSGKLSATIDTFKHRKWKVDFFANFIWLPLWTVPI